jgi:hypothetical protein
MTEFISLERAERQLFLPIKSINFSMSFTSTPELTAPIRIKPVIPRMHNNYEVLIRLSACLPLRCIPGGRQGIPLPWVLSMESFSVTHARLRVQAFHSERAIKGIPLAIVQLFDRTRGSPGMTDIFMV